jgi:opacity protein-like surface antigen
MRYMGRTRSARTLGHCVAALAAFAVSAAPAAAVAPSSPTSVPGGQSALAGVQCGGHYSRALGGGFIAPGFSPQNNVTTIRTRLVRTSRHAWEVGATSLGSETGAILPVAYCTKLKGKQVTVSASATVAPNAPGTATATCPMGYRAVSGGFDSPGFDLNGGGHVLTLTSMRVGDNAWQVSGVNPDFGGGVSPGQLVAYAYCLKGTRAITTVSADVAVNPQDDPVNVDVLCPPRTRALSGGFDGHITVSQNGLNAAGTIDSYRLDARRGWRATATDAGEDQATVTSYAYCEPKPPVRVHPKPVKG